MLRFLGTTTIGLAHGDILLVINPARSRVSIPSCTHWWCFKANVYGRELTGGLSPMSMSIVMSCVLPKSSLLLENIVGYLSHNSSKADLVVGLTSASCRSTFLGPGISAGDVRNALSMGTAGSLYFACFLREM